MLGQEVGGIFDGWVQEEEKEPPDTTERACLSSHPGRVLLGSGTLKSGHFQATVCIPICMKLNILCKHPPGGVANYSTYVLSLKSRDANKRFQGKSEKDRAFRATPGLWCLPSVWPQGKTWRSRPPSLTSSTLAWNPWPSPTCSPAGSTEKTLQRSRRWWAPLLPAPGAPCLSGCRVASPGDKRPTAFSRENAIPCSRVDQSTQNQRREKRSLRRSQWK